jgi:hypothetical protein
MNISLPLPLNEYIQRFKPKCLNISQSVLQVGVSSYPMPLSQFRHKLRKEFSVIVNVTVEKGNCYVSFSAEGTATHEAAVTAADCPNSRPREVDLLIFQFCSTGKRIYQVTGNNKKNNNKSNTTRVLYIIY